MKFKKEKIKGCIIELFISSIVGVGLILLYIHSRFWILVVCLGLLLVNMQDTQYIIKIFNILRFYLYIRFSDNIDSKILKK